MAKTLVTYFTRTGNTKLVAEAIFEALPGDKTLKPMAEAGDLAPYALIFVGFPVQTHSVPYPGGGLPENDPRGKEGRPVLHPRLGDREAGCPGKPWSTPPVLVAKAKLVGTFSCRGKVSMKALEVLMQSPEHEAWADMAASAATHPDAHDLEDARAFARWIMTLERPGSLPGPLTGPGSALRRPDPLESRDPDEARAARPSPARRRAG